MLTQSKAIGQLNHTSLLHITGSSYIRRMKRGGRKSACLPSLQSVQSTTAQHSRTTNNNQFDKMNEMPSLKPFSWTDALEQGYRCLFVTTPTGLGFQNNKDNLFERKEFLQKKKTE
jgi:hypothetical protein